MELSHQPERSDSALDVIEHELYNPKNKNGDNYPHQIREKRSLDLPSSWGDDSLVITKRKEEVGLSFGAKLLLGSVIFLVLAVGFTAWKVFSSRNVVSSANIDMSLDVSPYAEGGESIPLTFTLLNRNRAALLGASVTLSYKQGAGSQDEQEKVYEKRDLGDIQSNDNKRQDFTVILYGSEAEQRDITLKLEYKVAGSNALFSKVVTSSTVLKTPQIAVHIDGPTLLSVGQSGTFVISVKNNSATSSPPSVLQVTLPNTFTLTDQTPRSSGKGTVWSLRPLDPGQTASTTLVGFLGGTQGETTTMKAQIGSRGNSSTNIGVVYSSQILDIKLRASPLALNLGLETDGGATEALRYGDRAVVNISYVNTSDVTLQNVTLKLSVAGDAVLLKKIDPTNGYYDSLEQTIVWDKTNSPELAKVLPHANGTVRVAMPIVTGGTNSPLLKVTLTGAGSSQYVNDIVSSVSKTWKVQGSATLRGETTYKNSPIPNVGAIPPQANKETTYSVHLLVSAQNALTNTRVSFILPTYVSWRNLTTDQNAISFDGKTRTVTWLLGDMPADKTVGAYISLSVKPSQSQVNQMPPITSGIVLDADELVSQAHLRTTISPLTTSISGEVWDVNPSLVVDSNP